MTSGGSTCVTDRLTGFPGVMARGEVIHPFAFAVVTLATPFVFTTSKLEDACVLLSDRPVGGPMEAPILVLLWEVSGELVILRTINL